MRPSKTRRGFTLLELLIAVTVSGILMGGILSLFLVFSRLFHEGSMQMNIQGRAWYGIERIASGVSAAETVSAVKTIAVQSVGDRLDVTVPVTNLRGSGNLASSATTIPVVSTGVLPGSGVAYIDSEKIRYGAKDALNLLSCTRGYGGTTAAFHESSQVVYMKFCYYLKPNSTSVFLNADQNADGSLNTATDERILWAVEKNAGVKLFDVIAQSGTYRFDRIVLSFKCYDDMNNNNRREPSEPGLDFALEVFPRNG
jgi:prepilin-type N-terminal cleavage/methylation domain-containing protein